MHLNLQLFGRLKTGGIGQHTQGSIVVIGHHMYREI
nr:MAG TPA: hypothetical protein [Caudoviricetes sp.]